MDYGIQLYSVRDVAKEDLEAAEAKDGLNCRNVTNCLKKTT